MRPLFSPRIDGLLKRTMALGHLNEGEVIDTFHPLTDDNNEILHYRQLAEEGWISLHPIGDITLIKVTKKLMENHQLLIKAQAL